ncbi:hypothetical protein H6G41_32565 [Tolypothrix sp. FACHB-123]|uniref:hypothetical protein n=1 Tax=Tolypothrix sp. FACHB-123 TaxID=2692868 RepID=UPI001686B9D1|nr:hypothetical protein [Tolypothrix sp. FACHB-123]MBD2359265.1 hypothetical protein [Tolypothrix sp. FACHB-123]
MSADSPTSAPAPSNQNAAKLGKFLIPRSQTQNFLIKFTCITCLGWVVGGFASIAAENLLNQLSPDLLPDPQIWNVLVSFVSSAVFALIFAADQALVIRPYIPGWWWLIATSIGWQIASTVSTGWINYIKSIAASFNENVPPEAMLLLGGLSTIAYIISGIWLGFCQWLVLRRYTVNSWWWNFLPAVCFFFISTLIWLLSLLQNFIPEANRTSILYWNGQGFTAFILGFIPAIGLCTLKRKSHHKSVIPSSS